MTYRPTDICDLTDYTKNIYLFESDACLSICCFLCFDYLEPILIIYNKKELNQFYYITSDNKIP